MTRLLVDTASLDGDFPRLGEASLHHLKVLRPEIGERIELFDGCGAFRRYVYESGSVKNPVLKPLDDKKTEPLAKNKAVLFACVTKGSRWDWTIEKATELGASEIVPVISSRTIVRLDEKERSSKRERWQRVADDAARQCGAYHIAKVHSPVDFEEALSLAGKMRTFVGALVEPTPRDFFDLLSTGVLRGTTNESFGIFVGPEGDFTSDELQRLCSVAEPVTFGPNVLRAETAAIYALSLLVSALR
jgi:16S rRNA (uracil1498-N3)-methyltransferase